MNLKPSYISLALALALAACSDKGEPAPEILSDENPMYMSFSISMQNPSGTRSETPPAPAGSSDWGHIDDPRDGNTFETSLLSDYFTPVLVEANDPSQKAGTFKILSFTPIQNNNSNTTTYLIHGSFAPDAKYDTPEKLQKANLRLMVFANAQVADGTPYENITFSQISSQTAYDASKTDAENEGFDAIPMWGVTTVDLSKSKPGSYSDITSKNGPCNLLRAMAKVVVRLDLQGAQANSDVEIESIELNRYNPSGYLLPKKENWVNLAYTTDLSYDDSFNVNETGQVKHTVNADNTVTNPFITKKIRLDDTSNKQYVAFYLPEMENKEDEILTGNFDPKKCIEITLNYKVHGQSKSNHLYFTKYENGGPRKENGKYQLGDWNIVRNHIYEFTITGVQDSKITVQARVNDWKYHKGEPQPLE